MISNNLAQKYNITRNQISTTPSNHGTLLRLTLTPNSSHLNLPTLSITNLYLKTGTDPDAYQQKTNQVRLLQQLPTADYSIVGGDLNFVEREDDTNTAAHHETKAKLAFLEVWWSYLRANRLREIHQPTHTWHGVSLHNPSLSKSSRLDRGFTSFTEADGHREPLCLSATHSTRNPHCISQTHAR